MVMSLKRLSFTNFASSAALPDSLNHSDPNRYQHRSDNIHPLCLWVLCLDQRAVSETSGGVLYHAQMMLFVASRLIGRARLRAKMEDRSGTTIRYTPQEVIERVEALMSSLEITRAIADGDTIGREVEDNAKIILNAHLRCNLASRKILQEELLQLARGRTPKVCLHLALSFFLPR